MLCDYCPKSFTSSYVWNAHVVMELEWNKDQITAVCRNCGYDAVSLRKLGIHLKSKVCRHSDVPKDQCPHCDRYFTTKTILQKHIDNNACRRLISSTPAPKKNLYCGICWIKVDSQRELLNHARAAKCKRPGPPTCDKCSKVFSNKYTLANHIKRHVCTKQKIALAALDWDMSDIQLFSEFTIEEMNASFLV
jgi:hypothetical protein